MRGAVVTTRCMMVRLQSSPDSAPSWADGALETIAWSDCVASSNKATAPEPVRKCHPTLITPEPKAAGTHRRWMAASSAKQFHAHASSQQSIESAASVGETPSWRFGRSSRSDPDSTHQHQ